MDCVGACAALPVSFWWSLSYAHTGLWCRSFASRPSKVPFIENKISLIEFAREKVA